ARFFLSGYHRPVGIGSIPPLFPNCQAHFLNMRQTMAALALMLFLIAAVGAPVGGAPTEEQRQELRVLKTEIRKTANCLKRGMVVESVALVRDIQARIEKLGSADAQEIMPELE